ncbi:MAG: CRISPR-associated endonuclease Cas3'', partial [Dehalococcoidia bacterium]
MFAAHSVEGRARVAWHPLAEHLEAVAGLAGDRGEKFGAGRAAALAGLLHDLGKYTAAFQRRLDGSSEQVDHSTAGAQEVGRIAQGGMDRGIAELLSYAIAGHHAGLPDKEAESASLAERLRKPLEPLDPTWRREIRPEATGLFPQGFRPDSARLGFQLAFLGRMIFSCLVDSDYRDTEAFYASVEQRETERAEPSLQGIVEHLVASLDAHMTQKRASAADTPVNHLRQEILTHVRGRASDAVGLFTLTVPTGGGKTLASLAFALDHAKRHGLDRVVYAIPFTSVIEQTAAIFREVLGEEIVLEHHSAIDEQSFGAREGSDKLRLAMEDWAAPIVVTTNVQLFESLFANRPSRCRKLHNLARSVLILDEAQTIPLPVLRPCVAALDELSRNYRTSVVLCTATQPALAAPKFRGGG